MRVKIKLDDEMLIPIDEIIEEDYEDRFVIIGNSDLKTYANAPWFETTMSLIEVLDETSDEFSKADVSLEECAYLLGCKISTTFLEAVANNLTEDNFKKIVDLFNNRQRNEDIVCEVASILYGCRFEERTIRGCCQSDWNYAYGMFNSEEDEEGIDKMFNSLEAYYFGNAYAVYGEYEDGSDTGICFIPFEEIREARNEETLKELLVDILELDEDDDLIVLETDGEIRTTKWKEVAI